MPDFWYIIGCDYEIIVFPTFEQAKTALEELKDTGNYYYILEGRYGEEFSGWLGRGRDKKESTSERTS